MSNSNNNSDRQPTVIYARYSSAAQREESIEGQVRECTEYAKAHNLQIIDIYADKALTGRTDKRPAFQKMLKDSAKHKFVYVLCWKLDRFSRNRYDSAVYKAKLKKNGVKVIYAKEHIPEGPEGIILESVMEGFAEYYSANLAQNIRRGLTDSAMQCKALGQIPFGFRRSSDNFYEPDPLTAPIVTKIFEEYSSGVPAVQIIKELNDAGIKTAMGKEFSRSSIKRIIKNKKYMGVYTWDSVEVEGGLPALVTRELWEKAQKMADLHHHSPAAARAVRYELTGKVRCGLCGSNMVGESCTSKTGKIHYYYICFSRKKSTGCKAARIRKSDLEDYVDSTLARLAKSPGFAENVADAVMEYLERENTDTSEMDALTLQLKEATGKHKNIMNAIEMGIITAGTKSRLLELEDDIERLKSAIAQLDLRKPDLTRDHILYYLDKAMGEALTESLLNCVYMYDDHADFVLNYTKNAEPATFTDYCSALNALEGSYSGRLVDHMTRKANLLAFAGGVIVRAAI